MSSTLQDPKNPIKTFNTATDPSVSTGIGPAGATLLNAAVDGAMTGTMQVADGTPADAIKDLVKSPSIMETMPKSMPPKIKYPLGSMSPDVWYNQYIWKWQVKYWGIGAGLFIILLILYFKFKK